MLSRMLHRGLITYADYLAVDQDPLLLKGLRRRLPVWAENQGLTFCAAEDGGMRLKGTNTNIRVRTLASDLFDLTAREKMNFPYFPEKPEGFDLVVAHHFLDLVDLNVALRLILKLLRPGGLFYTSLNFDGHTVFEPPVDPELDAQIERLYHESMDAAHNNGRSHTGRRLLTGLRASGASILDAGASDWVIVAGPYGYREGEERFLQHILQFVRHSLSGHADLDPGRFDSWLQTRHEQINQNELTLIVHQIDVLARRPLR